jgi:hypothetical protein
LPLLPEGDWSRIHHLGGREKGKLRGHQGPAYSLQHLTRCRTRFLWQVRDLSDLCGRALAGTGQRPGTHSR